MRLALKIDVDTCRGTREGVPRLVELLKRQGAGASFLFSLGPDHTGRAIKRIFRPGFFSKVKRTSVLKHYGLRTLLCGTLLPGPDIGRACADVMRATRDQGFEVGIHCWEHTRWQDTVAGRDADWTEREMQRADERFASVFWEKSRIWGAAGWQTNRHAAWFEERNYDYASDTRGHAPFWPLWNGVRWGCPQLPTTLPTLDELLGLHANVVEKILDLTRHPSVHVYTAHAELEGGKLMADFETLLSGWQAQGYELVPMRGVFERLDLAALPRHEVIYGEVAGRSGKLALQAKETG